MTNDRFKELLNLHLDHRLTVAEASELEQALRDPERRRVYRSYAAMQSGCAELFRRSAEDSPAPDVLLRALRQVEGRMQRPERRESAWLWRTWGAGAGVAALIAVVVVRVNPPSMGVQAQADPKTEPLVAAAPVTALENAPEAASPRVRMPEHLTLAALGIAPDSRFHPSLARWSEPEPTTINAYSVVSGTEVVWPPDVSAAALESWSRPRSSAAAFSGRPINAWATQPGFQVQNASYTFER